MADASDPAATGAADSTWGTAEVKQALAEITPAVNGTAPTPAGRPKNEDALKLAREAGWVQPSSYNYAAKAPVTVLNGEEFEPQPEAGVGDSSFSKPQTSTWSYDAVKYEWEDSFGDVGPRDEKLEKELFQGEHINRQGAKIER
jgi:ATP-dependent RNA helicase DDX3X